MADAAPAPPEMPTPSRALCREIANHDRIASAWSAGALRKRMMGDNHGARFNDAQARTHWDLANIKREAHVKLVADMRAREDERRELARTWP